MKKAIFVLAILGLVSSVVAKEWTCYRYINGKPTGGFIKVQADNKEEAEIKSMKKYKKLGYSLDYTKCEVSW